MIEHLHLDAARRQRARFQIGERLFAGPHENARVAGRLQVPPLGHELEVRDLVLRAHHADRLARAVDDAVLPGPRVGIAIDVGEILLAQLLPAGAGAVDEGLGKRGLVFGADDRRERQERPTDADHHKRHNARGICCHNVYPGRKKTKGLDATIVNWVARSKERRAWFVNVTIPQGRQLTRRPLRAADDGADCTGTGRFVDHDAYFMAFSLCRVHAHDDPMRPARELGNHRPVDCELLVVDPHAQTG